MRCAKKKQQDVQKNNKMYKKRKQKTVYSVFTTKSNMI